MREKVSFNQKGKMETLDRKKLNTNHFLMQFCDRGLKPNSDQVSYYNFMSEKKIFHQSEKKSKSWQTRFPATTLKFVIVKKIKKIETHIWHHSKADAKSLYLKKKIFKNNGFLLVLWLKYQPVTSLWDTLYFSCS